MGYNDNFEANMSAQQRALAGHLKALGALDNQNDPQTAINDRRALLNWIPADSTPMGGEIQQGYESGDYGNIPGAKFLGNSQIGAGTPGEVPDSKFVPIGSKIPRSIAALSAKASPWSLG